MDLNKIIWIMVIILLLTSVTVIAAKPIKEKIIKPIEMKFSREYKPTKMEKTSFIKNIKEVKVQDVKFNPEKKFKTIGNEIVVTDLQVDGNWITQITTYNKYSKGFN